MTTLPAGVFDGLSSLPELNLGGQQLSTLPAGVFDGLDSLRQMDLSDNQLSTLPRAVFDGLPELRVLDLSANQLSTLPRGVFSTDNNGPKLSSLFLNQNQFSTLPDGVFEGVELEKLELHDNPGSPFELRMELTHRESMLLNVEVALGAPIDMWTDITITGGGMRGGTKIRVWSGSTKSGWRRVYPTAGSDRPMVLSLEDAPSLPVGFTGLRVVMGDPLSLTGYGSSDDMTPQPTAASSLAGTAPAPTLSDGGGGFPWWVILLILIVVGVGVVLLVATRRRRREAHEES